MAPEPDATGHMSHGPAVIFRAPQQCEVFRSKEPFPLEIGVCTPQPTPRPFRKWPPGRLWARNDRNLSCLNEPALGAQAPECSWSASELDKFQRPDRREEVVPGLWSGQRRQAIFCQAEPFSSILGLSKWTSAGERSARYQLNDTCGRRSRVRSPCRRERAYRLANNSILLG